MSILTHDKITEIFCIADDFCKEFAQEVKRHQITRGVGTKRRNRSSEMSDSEIITILLCFHFGSFRNFKHYYLFYVREHLKKEVPKQLSYNRFVEIEHKIAVPMVLFLKLICFGECTGITFVDSTKIAVCHNKRIKRNRVFKDMAATGKTTVGWFYGFKLHLVCNDRGELLNFCITRGNDELKNICQIEHSRHRGTANFLINLLAALAAYCFFDKKPSIHFEKELDSKQLALFF